MENLISPLIYLFKEILIFFEKYTNSWGWSIILLTVLIKMILFPTLLKQTRVMNKMKEIQPKLKELQDKYKDKPEEFQRRTMELYQKEKVNPFSSCLPMLIQLPLLIAIFYLLSNTKYMGNLIQDATFLGMHLKDSHNVILAVISGITTFFQQKLTTPTAGTDPSQKVMLIFMPVFFAFITWQVNVGVGLYWTVSNVVGITQQYLINEYFLVKEHIHHSEPQSKTGKKD